MSSTFHAFLLKPDQYCLIQTSPETTTVPYPPRNTLAFQQRLPLTPPWYRLPPRTPLPACTVALGPSLMRSLTSRRWPLGGKDSPECPNQCLHLFLLFIFQLALWFSYPPVEPLPSYLSYVLLSWSSCLCRTDLPGFCPSWRPLA